MVYAKIFYYFLWPYPHNIGIQMNQKELTKTFMISNCLKPFGLYDLYKINSAL